MEKTKCKGKRVQQQLDLGCGCVRPQNDKTRREPLQDQADKRARGVVAPSGSIAGKCTPESTTTRSIWTQQTQTRDQHRASQS
eukprot:2025800-Rhodomonas_salina.2